jgi:hypothetical protein
MVTYRQLRDARPAAWRDSAEGWRRLATAFAGRADAVEAIVARLRERWRGAAAEAAMAALGALATVLRAARGPALACDQALCEHAGEIERIQRRLAALLAAPYSPLVSVDDFGGVHLSPAHGRPDPTALAAARRTAATIAEVLDAAQVSDERAGIGLRAAALEFTAGDPAPSVDPPPVGTDPAAVNRWWQALSPAARAWLLARRSDEVGALDGVPIAVRDTANRWRLDRLLAVERHPKRADALRSLAARLDRTDPARAYLVAFDSAGDGRAVVAIGDADHARHVLTHVPGAGSDLNKVAGLLGRTERMAAAAGAGTAAVLWLGYDAPEGLSAAGTGAAHAAADDLDRFQEGLRVTAAGPPAHHTIVGHSYGSLVVGTAAHDLGLPVEDVVFVGSPGVGVDRAADLGIPAEHVWSSTARFDAVRLTAFADRELEPLDPDIGLDRWHGADPGDPRFGGRTFPSDPGQWYRPVTAHNAYFDDGSTSLAAIGAIARGDYNAVQP